MKMRRALRGCALLALLLPRPALAQAQTSLMSLLVAYSTRKAVANPTGELKARLDTVDAALQTANRAGQTAEVRRLLARGTALLGGRAWTDSADFATSLLLRSDRVVIESQQPFQLRLAQQYKPLLQLPRTAATRVLLVQAASPLRPQGGTSREVGRFQGLQGDLQAAPFPMTLDLHEVADGRYNVVVEVLDSTRVLGATSLAIDVARGIDARVSELENAARNAPAGLRSEILYPVNRMQSVNRGLLELRMLDVDKDFRAAEAVATAARSGGDPLAGRTGDLKRHYLLDAANEIMPYRLYVPSSYKASASMPLIIALHGLGATEDSFFDSYGRKLPELAQEHGYIVAAPLGYRVDGGYGWGIGTPPADSVSRRSTELSELDVMGVLAQVRQLYNIDSRRIYLMGHSLGAIGTWKLAAKYPDNWAALGAFAGQGTPASAEKMQRIPQYVVHGDADPTVNVRGSRTMVSALKALNAEVVYIEVPGGTHSNVVQPGLAGMIEFFNTHRKP